MNHQQKRISTATLVITILLLASASFCWILLGYLEDIISPAMIMMLQIFLIISTLVTIVLIIWLLRAPSKDRENIIAMQNIIDEASLDTDTTRTAIIRLRQILEPEQQPLALSIATLLDNLLIVINDVQGLQESDKEQTLSVSQAASELKLKHDQLLKAPNSKSEFLSRMGDEITLPMKSLENMLRLMKNIELPNETRDLLIIATHSAHSLIENLTNILNFSKLDAGLLALNKESFEVYETVSCVIETQESIALSKGLLIETHIKPDVPALIMADKKSVMKVLDNLISNAIRFTDHGQIQLSVDLQNQGNKELLRITVIDTGIGIPETALGGLFDSLEADTDLVNSSFTGRLRLIVCKQLCELMGGEIGVRSIQGEGSQFWFTVDISN